MSMLWHFNLVLAIFDWFLWGFFFTNYALLLEYLSTVPLTYLRIRSNIDCGKSGSWLLTCAKYAADCLPVQNMQTPMHTHLQIQFIHSLSWWFLMCNGWFILCVKMHYTFSSLFSLNRDFFISYYNSALFCLLTITVKLKVTSKRQSFAHNSLFVYRTDVMFLFVDILNVQ